MTAERARPMINLFYDDLKIVKNKVYDKCGFQLTNFQRNAESVAYSACSFQLNDKKIQYRLSKITPTKSGQFVTVWKRNKVGITVPFDISDDIDFILVTAKSANNFGQFIFPKSVLGAKGVLARNGKGGKRGMRVYPPWDMPSNPQAAKTQQWQSEYFLTIKEGNTTDLDSAKYMLQWLY